jgi:hypothetical protein
VLLRAAKWLVVLSLTVSIGAHWVFLQSVAWFGMVVSYSQSSSLPQALEMTFDGQHPCKLCKLVQQGKESEKKQAQQKLETKLECWLIGEPLAFIVPQSDASLPVGVPFAFPRTEPPPTPPPRLT